MTRQPVEATKRRGFTPAQRQMVFDRQGGLCACCAAPLGADFEVDHILRLFLGGAHEPRNWEALRYVCHKVKTKAEAPVNAKVRRIQKREAGEHKPSRLKGPKFVQKPVYRGVDGKVRVRKPPHKP